MNLIDTITPNKHSRLRLMCFHYGGGSAASFYPWKEKITPYNVELLALNLPGRGYNIDQPLLDNIEDILSIFKHRSERGFPTEFEDLKYASFMPTNNSLINDLLSDEAKEKLTQAYNGSRGIGTRFYGGTIPWDWHQQWLDDQDPDRLEEALDLIKIEGLFE